MNHIWQPSAISPKYLVLQGATNALIRIEPLLDGRYLWQFRAVAGFADSVEKAKDYVEAGAEFFDVFRRNPYAD